MAVTAVTAAAAATAGVGVGGDVLMVVWALVTVVGWMLIPPTNQGLSGGFQRQHTSLFVSLRITQN